jgi:hypothetical protein
VALAIADHADLEGVAALTIARIGEITGVGRRHIGKLIRDLEAMSAIRIIERRGRRIFFKILDPDTASATAEKSPKTGRSRSGVLRAPITPDEWLASRQRETLPTALQWLERYVQREPELGNRWPAPWVERLAGIALFGGYLGPEKIPTRWGLAKRERNPPALLQDAVLLDMAEFFRLATAREPTRSVRSKKDYGETTEAGQFFEVARAAWVQVFGSERGLRSAMRRWQEYRISGARSPILATIDARHPEWGLSDQNEAENAIDRGVASGSHRR